MNKKSIALLLAVTGSLASSAFAAGIIDKLITKHSSVTPSIMKAHKTAKQQPNHSYTDFSGTWVGNCGDGETFTTVIENGADYIFFGTEEFRIGQGLQGSYKSNEAMTEYEHTSFEWNKNGSELVMKGVYVYKENIDNSNIDTGMDKLSLTMKNGQINLDGKIVFQHDLSNVENPINVHCVFNKKQ